MIIPNSNMAEGAGPRFLNRNIEKTLLPPHSSEVCFALTGD